MQNLAIVGLLLFAALGCEESRGPIREVDRSDQPVTEDGQWASGPWVPLDPEIDGLIPIESETRIRLYHGLGRLPVTITAYLGFAVDSERLMPAAGNALEIWEVTEDFLVVRNGSGGSFFYRFVLR